ncbi:plasmid stabilization protein [Streptomyces sp. NPDC057496]|uniref:plasmid stabilization protein n=1 Tax=Streptomyces sp. NPDC057496 TaxID=3346149 RepID=UPI00367A2209
MSHGSGVGRHRQYEHIKESAQERGVGEERAEGIAARTAGGDHFRTGPVRTARRVSAAGPSSVRHDGAEGPTRDQLYEEARRKNVHGRSTMTKAELARAVGR